MNKTSRANLAVTKAFCILLLLVFHKTVLAQKTVHPADKKLVAAMATSTSNQSADALIFSAVRGTSSRTRTPVFVPAQNATVHVTIKGADAKNFKLDVPVSLPVIKGKKIKLPLQFTPSADLIGVSKAQLDVTDASGKLLYNSELRGLSLRGLEGENEPTLQTVFDILGYKVTCGWTTLANNALPVMQGEEINAGKFKKAHPGKINMIPLARFSPDFELPFGYYTQSAAGPQLHQVGVLSKANDKPQHQILYPELNKANSSVGSDGDNFASFDPGENVFGFYNTSLTHTSFTSDVWNALMYPKNAVHAARIYPAKNKDGSTLPGQYLLCFEEAKNGDYNDYVFLVDNIKPFAEEDDYRDLFNGKNLDGWDIFLTDKGLNHDNEGNFGIANKEIHVRGKELGYIRTKESFTNYSFKVDFRWGEKKWPPHQDFKRDAGICYNIPPNEPDSIWPQSIECQIQEGDVGDFWLLGFSTITVNDSTNKPTNHTRMVKKADAEKPNGEWNTVEVISYNGKCVHLVNGVVVNEGEKASVKYGRILLQSEYAEVYYRNVKIKKL